MKNIALILASGTGSRMGLNIPKQFYKILGKTVLEYSVSAFQNHKDIDEIIVVSNPDFIDLTTSIVDKNVFTKVSNIIKGGKTRQESSYIGVHKIDNENANVLIHDAVRPFVSNKIISDCVNALDKYSAVNTTVETTDTIIEINDDNLIKSVPQRKYLRRCQTPQCFKVNLIKKAHNLALENGFNSATDDCSLILKYNLADIFVINGSENNIKITYPADIITAENILKSL